MKDYLDDPFFLLLTSSRTSTKTAMTINTAAKPASSQGKKNITTGIRPRAIRNSDPAPNAAKIALITN